MESNDFYIANLGFMLNFTDGYQPDEVNAELFRLIFQNKGSVHYDRANGGSFGDIEQEKSNNATILLFLSNIIESVYRLNESRSFDPYIIIDANNIQLDNSNKEFNPIISWRILQDLQVEGQARINI
jgi:hypothetical protein